MSPQRTPKTWSDTSAIHPKATELFGTLAPAVGCRRMAAHPFRTAWETRDLTVLVAAFSPDVVLRSPILSEPFRGRDEVAELYEVIFDVVHGLEFTDELEGEGTHAFFWRAEVDKRPVEGVDLLRAGPGGEIEEITVMARPLAGAAAFA